MRAADNFNPRGAKSRYRPEDNSTIHRRPNGDYLIERDGRTVTFGNEDEKME